MDLLLKDLMSTETMGKLAAVEKTASKLANRSWLKDVPVRIRTVSPPLKNRFDLTIVTC